MLSSRRRAAAAAPARASPGSTSLTGDAVRSTSVMDCAFWSMLVLREVFFCYGDSSFEVFHRYSLWTGETAAWKSGPSRWLLLHRINAMAQGSYSASALQFSGSRALR